MDVTLRIRSRAVLPLVTLLAVGCSSGGNFSKRASEARQGTFTYAMAVAPTTLDPALVQDVETSDLLLNIYEGLVAYDENNRIVGALAEKWEVSEDGKTYTFQLRPGAKFQNGRQVTAEDVKWTLERNLAKDFNSPTAINYLSDILGATDLNEGKAKELAGVKVKGEGTVVITIDKPRPYFLGKLAYPCAHVLAKEVAGTKPINDLAHSGGTGPFKLADYQVDQALHLEAFADYHGGAPQVATIMRPIIQDAATRLNKYRGGELDLLTVQRQEIPAVTSDGELKSQVTYQPRPMVFYVGLCQTAYPPFKDRRVRAALAHAIDRKRITEELLGGMPLANGLLPHFVMGYREEVQGLSYDPKKAKALLAEAGFPNGEGLPPLRLIYRVQTPDSQAIAEAIATSVRQSTGWNLRPTSLEWTAMLQGRNKRQLEAYLLSWYGDYLDPQNFLSFLFQSDSPQNRDGYSNAEFDRLSRQADVSQDEKARLDLYAKAEDVLIQDVARIPIYYGRDAVLISPKVKGIRSNLFGNLAHAKVTLE